MNRILIEVSGGIVQAVHSEENIEIIILDHDSLELDGTDEIDVYEPDSIISRKEQAEIIKKSME